MGRGFRYISSIFLVSCILAGAVWFLLASQGAEERLASPLPAFLTRIENKQVTLLDFWLPFIEKTEGSTLFPPTLTAKSVLMYDLTTNKTLFEKDSEKKLPMASLTKIMTAIVSLENPRSDNHYIVHGSDLVGEDSMGLTAGEVLSLEELLYGLMLPSGNDAAEVLASNSPFGREGFLQAMNDKAKALGLTDTKFSNPSGLQGDGVQYTTAHDLLVMTRYAIERFPLLIQISQTPEHEILETDTHKGYYLVSETNLLTTYEGVKGFKTGYTPEAGLCLITYYEHEDHKIIGILLNSENRRIEMKDLLDYSLTSLGIDPPEYLGG